MADDMLLLLLSDELSLSPRAVDWLDAAAAVGVGWWQPPFSDDELGLGFLLPEPASAPRPEALAPPAPGEHGDAAAAAPRQHEGVAWSAELQTVREFELSDEERRYKRSLLEYMRDAMEEDEEEEEEEAGPSGASAFEYLQVLQQQKGDIDSERTSTMSALLVQETCPKVLSCFVDEGLWNENEKRFDGPPDWELVEARLQALCETSIPEEAGVATNDSEKVKSYLANIKQLHGTVAMTTRNNTEMLVDYEGTVRMFKKMDPTLVNRAIENKCRALKATNGEGVRCAEYYCGCGRFSQSSGKKRPFHHLRTHNQECCHGKFRKKCPECAPGMVSKKQKKAAGK